MAKIIIEINDIELNGKPDIAISCACSGTDGSLRVKAYASATSELVKAAYQDKHFHCAVKQALETEINELIH